jgi:hypothetical protein
MYRYQSRESQMGVVVVELERLLLLFRLTRTLQPPGLVFCGLSQPYLSLRLLALTNAFRCQPVDHHIIMARLELVKSRT